MDFCYLVDRLGSFEGIQGLLLKACPNVPEIAGVEVTDALHGELMRFIEGGEPRGDLPVEFEFDLGGQGREWCLIHLP